MGIRAGDILNASWYGMNFDPAPETDVTIFTQTMVVETTANGNGTDHNTGRRRRPGFDGFAVSVAPNSGKLEFLSQKQASGVPGAFAITLIDGTTYGGMQMPQGEINLSTGTGQITLAGRGTLERV